jgi:hypothetical protein
MRSLGTGKTVLSKSKEQQRKRTQKEIGLFIPRYIQTGM